MSQVVPARPTSRAQPTAGRRSPKPRSAPERGESLAPVIVASDASFDGWLTCPGAARIDGRFRGNAVAEGRIEIGETADVSGRIEAEDIVVAGSFEGELFASHSIELLSTARVTGELHARELSAEEGCTVTGLCRTGSAPKTSG